MSKINNKPLKNIQSYKNKNTIDDILGTYTYDEDLNDKLSNEKNEIDKHNKQTKNNIETKNETKNENENKKISQSINTNIDYILNNETFNFENKLQKSMFFVDYKSMDTFLTTLKTKCNFTVPKEIIDDHIMKQIPNIIKEYTSNLKKRCKKVINTEYICLGRKLDNKQCTRKKHNGTDFCKSHLIKLSNGRIDEPTPTVIHNKRGRKRKVEFDPRQYDNNYITLWEDIINGHKVLLDSNNNIYTYDLKSPKYIGKKTINTKIDLSILNDKKEDIKEDIKKDNKEDIKKDNKEDVKEDNK